MHERCILKLKIYTKIKRPEKNEKILSPFNATVPSESDRKPQVF